MQRREQEGQVRAVVRDARGAIDAGKRSKTNASGTVYAKLGRRNTPTRRTDVRVLSHQLGIIPRYSLKHTYKVVYFIYN